MNKLILVSVVLLGACQGHPETVTKVNQDFQVEKLFTFEGCTVYRFQDAGTVYFTNCKGSVKWEKSHGKTSSPMQVEGGAE